MNQLVGAVVFFSQYEGVTDNGDYLKVIDFVEFFDDQEPSGAGLGAAALPLMMLISTLLLFVFN